MPHSIPNTSALSICDKKPLENIFFLEGYFFLSNVRLCRWKNVTVFTSFSPPIFSFLFIPSVLAVSTPLGGVACLSNSPDSRGVCLATVPPRAKRLRGGKETRGSSGAIPGKGVAGAVLRGTRAGEGGGIMEVGGRRHVELPLDITGCCTKRGGELEAGKGDTWG